MGSRIPKLGSSVKFEAAGYFNLHAHVPAADGVSESPGDLAAH